MAKLPNKPFLFNYNALQYDAETLTLPKTKGQLFNQDLVFTQAPTYNAGDAYFNINTNMTGCNCSFDFSTENDNPFNRDASNSTFTFIYKVASMQYTLLGNRNNNLTAYNYMVRFNSIHTRNSNTLLLVPPTTGAYVMYIRVNADGTGERKCITTNQTVTTNNINWGNKAVNTNFFCDYKQPSQYASERFAGDFYWMYCSNEVLTDEEIQQVINYNENPSSFSTTPDTLDFNYNGVSQNVTVAAEEGVSWTATTLPSWIGLSQSEGTGTTTVTVSASKNTSYTPRTGTIIFESDDDDAAEVSITQEKYPLIVPINNFKINRGGE